MKKHRLKRWIGMVGLLLQTGWAIAQVESTGDSMKLHQQAVSDTLTTVLPATTQPAFVPPPPPPDTTLRFFNSLNEYLPTNGALVYRFEEGFTPNDLDHLFYLFAGALLVLGIIRIGFAKYFADLIRIFSQTAIRQKSLREQLVQNRLASLLLNLFFAFSAGAFLYQLGTYKHWLPSYDIWWHQLLLCIALIASIYLVKYLVTLFVGWLFDLSDLAESYVFMVFLINKVVGILLLPVTISLALGSPQLMSVMGVVGLFVFGFLYLYRFVIAMPLVHQHVKVIPFHFFLYFCAFEIVPVLLIYKWLLSVLGHS